jgi:hypothetical protein
LRCRISARKKVPLCILGCNRLKSAADRCEESFLGSGFGRAEVSLDFAPHVFNGIEVRTVGWEEFEGRTARFDKGFRFLVLVSGEVVRDNDVTTPQGWAEYMPNVLAKDLSASCAVDGHAAGRPVKAHRANHGRGVPMSVRRAVAYALAAAATCAKTGHIRFRSGFIDKYELLHIAVLATVYPCLPTQANVRPVLFAGRKRFFLSCIPAEQLPDAQP